MKIKGNFKSLIGGCCEKFTVKFIAGENLLWKTFNSWYDVRTWTQLKYKKH